MPNQTVGSAHGQTSRRSSTNPPKDAFATKPQRRKAIREIILELEAIVAAEKRYVDNAPLNLQAAQKYEEAEQNIAIMEEAVDILADAF